MPPVIGASSTVPFTLTRGGPRRVYAVRPSSDRVSRTVYAPAAGAQQPPAHVPTQADPAHGASPFAATSTGAVIRRIVDTGPEPAAPAAVHALDPAPAAVVVRALNADPAGRPADGAALLELLTAAPAPGVPAPNASSVREEITRGWRTLAL
ncbi:hypothetical protein ACIOGZ_05195 [Kitasatospora sp. NPDC088160]|uniref:hypothetical protein n=1 Tax=unclassified Kitasatospora TaxID=2633591 RepID=UPI0038085502